MKRLKDVAHLFSSESGHPAFSHRGDVGSVQLDRSAGRPIKTRHQPEQRRFTAPGRPHDRDRLFGWDLKAYTVEDGDGMSSRGQDYRNLRHSDHRKPIPFSRFMRVENDIIQDGEGEQTLSAIMRRGRTFREILLPAVVLILWPFAVYATSPSASDTRPRIVAFGDSLTAGLGVQANESYPAQLQRRLDDLEYPYRVINVGVSGDTTAGGMRRVPWILNNKPKLVILELGANDGLRGLDVDQVKHNLQQIIEQLRKAGATVILAGMKLPPNYGQDYTTRFEAIYPALAKEYDLPLIPFFLDGVGGASSLNQADGIHPTTEGYEIIVEQVLKVLEPVLSKHTHTP